MSLITLNAENPNYLDCDLEAVVLNPHGAIKYYNHYHTALYEDEDYDYFIPYQVRVLNRYAGIHRGPARRYPTLAMIITGETYTIEEERNGWGRLREYPNGWIMLNQTEAITGPGENPDYDIADQETATIPFKTEITISQMTIDRLWCYVPDQESWVKAEDISFNQAGKLYNALGLTVIDLDEIDFDNLPASPTLNDVGIYPQAYALRFHENSDYTYDGDYTKTDFSEIHELDFVYPETVYSYNCVYYKDNIDEDNELGRASFSCSISDWNPDWDTFLATSRTPYQRPTYGLVRLRDNTSLSGSEHRLVELIDGQMTAPSRPVEITEGYIALIGPKVDQYGEPTNSTTNYYQRVSYGGYTNGYLHITSNDYYTTVIKEYSEVADVADPILYRDTDLTLDWDYFGFERNLYRPTGYADGIYMWNPRTWDTKNVYFTFEELVRCGTQYVVYPSFEPDIYKIAILGNIIGSTGNVNCPNPGAIVPLVEDDAINDSSTGRLPLVYDFNISKEYTSVRYDVGPTNWREQLGYGDSLFIGAPYMVSSGSDTLYIQGIQDATFRTTENQPVLEKIKPKTTLTYNLSYERSSPNLVLGVGGSNINEVPETNYYLQSISPANTQMRFVKMEDNTNLKLDNFDLADIDIDVKTGRIYGVYNSLISYKNFVMCRYWIPVPKGMWYMRDGEWLRIEENGLLDLLSGDFTRSYRRGDGALNNVRVPGYSGTFNFTSFTADGIENIYLRNQDIDSVEPYDYFNGWSYTTNDSNYIVKLNTNTTTYQQPDTYAIQKRSLPNNLVVPVSKYTSDTANHVVGEWYYSGDQWFPSSSANIYSGTFDSSKLTKIQRSFAILNSPSTPIIFNEYLDPSNPTTTGAGNYSSKVNTVLTSYYDYADEDETYYFDGNYWVPQNHTSFNITETDTNYAISRSTNCYSYPIANAQYLVRTYQYGDRIHVAYVSTNNPDWGYTGAGWIQLANNTSEIL